MAFVRLYDTDEFAIYQGDVIKKSVSLVISPIDDFTEKKAIGPLKVTIDEGNIKPVKNLSGYYVFTDLKESNYKVKIISEFYFPEDKSIVIPIFDGKGPTSGAFNTILKDVSQLQQGDIVEFRNLAGHVEKREIIGIDTGTREISWADGLKYSYNAPEDEILTLKNLPFPISLKPLPSYPFGNHATLIRGLLEDSDKKPFAHAIIKVANLNIETKSDEKGEFVLYFNEIKYKSISIDIEEDKIENDKEKKRLTDIPLKEGIMKFLSKIKFPDS